MQFVLRNRCTFKKTFNPPPLQGGVRGVARHREIIFSLKKWLESYNLISLKLNALHYFFTPSKHHIAFLAALEDDVMPGRKHSFARLKLKTAV
jgi:hypothetical protein